MNKFAFLTASAALVGAGAYAAAPAKKAASPPPPITTYWMDVATQSGMGMSMSGGGAKPDMSQIMAMMNGGGAPMHMLDLRLASKEKPAAAPQADHLIPPGLQMGASLPLLTPVREQAAPQAPGMPTQFQRPKGRMQNYWGCGDHAGAERHPEGLAAGVARVHLGEHHRGVDVAGLIGDPQVQSEIGPVVREGVDYLLEVLGESHKRSLATRRRAAPAGRR